jgi:CheY-like chemotaxis protein
VKFTPEKGTIQVRAASGADSLTITVSDDGRGISAEFLPHVFDRFRQDDTSTTKQQAGLGLGLAIARHLIELHGGSVMVESRGLGHGAAFSVTLPLRAATPAPPVTPADVIERHRSTPAPGVARLAGVRVLVVDDQDDARELLVTVLEDAGASVIQANSVQAALATLAAGDVGVVISDIAMPDEDGYSFITRLRDSAMPEHGLPAVAVTAFARAEDRLRALKAGFDEHISKPIDPNRLVDVVARLRARSRAAAQP